MHHYRLGIGTALIAVAALTGCHSAGSTSAPTPTPSTPTTTSTASASRTSSPKPSAGAVSAAEAEKVYRTIHKNDFELEKMGGLAPNQPAPLMITNYASGQALKSYTTFNHKVYDLGIHWKSGTSPSRPYARRPAIRLIPKRLSPWNHARTTAPSEPWTAMEKPAMESSSISIVGMPATRQAPSR